MTKNTQAQNRPILGNIVRERADLCINTYREQKVHIAKHCKLSSGFHRESQNWIRISTFKALHWHDKAG